jgi:trimeric autotransporter adhesin
LFCSTPARAQDPPPPPPDSDPATQGPPPDAPPPPPPDPQTPAADKPAPKTDAPSQAPTVSVTPATPAPQVTSFEISGSVKSGKTPLPGVTVTAANTLTGKKYSIATGLDGSYKFSGLPRGRYVVRVEFMAFAPQTQEIVLKPDTPTGKFDAEMILASRQAEQSPTSAAIAAITGGRGFQSLSLENSLSALEGGASGGATGGGGTGGASAGDIASLPMGGAGTDVSNESVSISGAQGRSQDFGAGSEDDLQSRIEEFRQRAQAAGLIPGGPTQGGAGGGGGFGGPGGFGGGGPIAIGRLGRGFNVNQPHGFLYFSDDDANFDAKPYSLTGIETPKASYNFARFGANAGGPLTIPHIFNGGGKWFFFAGWNGSRGSQPYDAYSTVPTAAERAGNFSGATYNDGTPVAIFNPTTGEQFSFNGQANVINPALLSAQAKALLQYIPLPNLDTVTNNFHYVTDQDSDTDAISLRLIHNFGDSTNGPFGGGGRGGGGRNGRHAQNNINFGLNYSRNNSATVNPYPSLAGNTNTQGVQATGGWTYGNGRRTNILRFTYNHNHVSTSNLYSNNIDVAGLAGIGGVSTDPFDFGLPGISFTTFGGLTDPTPRRELDQTYTISDTLSWYRGKHNWRFGGDYRRILQSFRSAKNAEGSFVFTGLETSAFAPGTTKPVSDTGYDFADFLLGLPQQTTLQSGTNSYDFASNSFDLFAQDDWRILPKLSLNLGFRYEYNGPFTEGHDRIANLDVANGFTGASVVLPGQSGFPPSLIHPDRNDFAPRIGIAWRPLKNTVVRTGYGINYNLAQYANIIQNFAFQPPFATTATNITSAVTPLTLANGFPAAPPGLITNNFAVDPNYKLGYVQIWNLDIQRTLPHGFLLNVDYNGSKGTDLDVERAINIAGLQPFIYESSAGDSVFHAGSVRFRKRQSHGISYGAVYTFSKSIDDASSIGGGGSVVSQDPFDIAADRGLSSFNQTHKFTGNWIAELPFGENHRYLQRGALSHILNAWSLSGDFTIASGLWYTPRVLGNSLDIDRGVSGSLRADVTGEPITVSNPSALEWFNTAAFCSPSTSAGTTNTCVNPNGTSFGDAGRNIIQGPGEVVVDMSLSKTITVKESRALELRIQGANIFNFINYTAINTTVNSLQFGQVTSAGATRRVTLVARFRF